MKQHKPYKEIIWEIVSANDGIRHPEQNQYGGISVVTQAGDRYNFELCDENTLLYSLYAGVCDASSINPERRAQIMKLFSQEFGSAKSHYGDFSNARLHLGPLVDSNTGKSVLNVMAFIEYRWMGLKEFRRRVGDMCAKMDRCSEWLHSNFADLTLREVNIDLAATQTLLAEENN